MFEEKDRNWCDDERAPYKTINNNNYCSLLPMAYGGSIWDNKKCEILDSSPEFYDLSYEPIQYNDKYDSLHDD